MSRHLRKDKTTNTVRTYHNTGNEPFVIWKVLPSTGQGDHVHHSAANSAENSVTEDECLEALSET
jgi:hypothetical protein